MDETGDASNSSPLPHSLNLRLSERAIERLVLLREKMDLQTNEDVLLKALRLLDTLTEEVEKGKLLLLKDTQGNITRVGSFW